MSTIEKNKLSGSTDGLQTLVTGTATGATVTIHTAVSGTTDFDEIWIYADNANTTDVTLTIEWGGTTDPNNIIEKTIPGLGSSAGDGRINILDGQILQNAKVVKAFASVANVIKITGFINEIRK